MQIVMPQLLLLSTEKKIKVYVAADEFSLDTRGNEYYQSKDDKKKTQVPQGRLHDFLCRFLKEMVDNSISYREQSSIRAQGEIPNHSGQPLPTVIVNHITVIIHSPGKGHLPLWPSSLITFLSGNLLTGWFWVLILPFIYQADESVHIP